MPVRINNEALVGEQFYDWKVIEYVGKVGYGKSKRAAYRCICSCGEEHIVLKQNLVILNSCKSCSNCANKKTAEAKRFNLTGRRFGAWEVIRYAGNEKSHNYWVCKCDCGEENNVPVSHLMDGRSKRCLKCKNKSMVTEEAIENELLYRYNYSASSRNLEFSLEREEFFNLVYENCFYCNSAPNNCLVIKPNSENRRELRYNGLDRVDNKKGYSLDNVKTCCKFCNFAKGRSSYEDFLTWIQTIRNYCPTCKNED